MDLLSALVAFALSTSSSPVPFLSTMPQLEPLAGDWIEPLVGPTGQKVGMLVLPLGATEPRPIVVAVHGASGRPDWMCGAAHDALGPYPFVACPHPDGRMETMETWSDPLQLRRAVDRAVAAARRKHGAHVRHGDALYVGHSQGSMMAPESLALPGDASFFGAILYEGLPRNRDAAIRDLKKAGTSRVLLVSGQSGWASAHRDFARQLTRHGVAATHVHAESGHYFNAESISLMRRNLWWLLGERSAWRGDASMMTTAIP